MALKNNREFRGHTAVNGLGHIDDIRGAWPNIIRSPLYWSDAAQVEPMRIYAEFTASLLGKGSMGEGSEERRAARVWARRGEDWVGKSWGFPRGWQGERSRVKSSIVDSRRHSGGTDNRLRVCSAAGKTLAGRVLALRLNRDAGKWGECSWSDRGTWKDASSDERAQSYVWLTCLRRESPASLPMAALYELLSSQLSWRALFYRYSPRNFIYTNEILMDYTNFN